MNQLESDWTQRSVLMYQQVTHRPASHRSSNGPWKNRRVQLDISLETGPNVKIRPFKISSRHCVTLADMTSRWSSSLSTKSLFDRLRQRLRLLPCRERRRQHAATSPSASSNLFLFFLFQNALSLSHKTLTIYMHIIFEYGPCTYLSLVSRRRPVYTTVSLRSHLFRRPTITPHVHNTYTTLSFHYPPVHRDKRW